MRRGRLGLPGDLQQVPARQHHQRGRVPLLVDQDLAEAFAGAGVAEVTQRQRRVRGQLLVGTLQQRADQVARGGVLRAKQPGGRRARDGRRLAAQQRLQRTRRLIITRFLARLPVSWQRRMNGLSALQLQWKSEPA